MMFSPHFFRNLRAFWIQNPGPYSDEYGSRSRNLPELLADMTRIEQLFLPGVRRLHDNCVVYGRMNYKDTEPYMSAFL
jgi:hypothetical protein